MKTLITGALLFFFNFTHAQYSLQSADTTAFAIKDTVIRISDVAGWDTLDWQENEKFTANPKNTIEKVSYKRKYNQYRIGRTSGYRQMRTATYSYIWIEPVKKRSKQVSDSVDAIK